MNFKQAIDDLFSGATLSDSDWISVMDFCLDRFREYMSIDFEHDDSYILDSINSTFCRWFWSPDSSSKPLAFSWTAVLAAGRIGDGGFDLSAYLFVFHPVTRSRLVTDSGRSYLRYSFMRHELNEYVWHSLGWQYDEFGEWEHVQLSS